jgi:conjugative transfer signal peptidase TraF
VDWLIRILSFWVNLRLWVNLSPSLPLGVYHTVDAPPARGAIVVVCLPATLGQFAREREYLGRGPCPGGVERLGKRVAAVPGDTVQVSPEGVRINGFFVPGSRPLERDSRGRPLPRAAALSVVRPGELFLLSTDHKRSFDGRYLGPVRIVHLDVVKLLWSACGMMGIH